MSFFIFAEPRSGSNHLVSLLDSHPEITCHGEIFRPKFTPSKKIDSALKKWDCHQRRLYEPLKFLDEIKNVSTQNCLVGFKLFRPHLPSPKIELLTNDLRVIHLERDNLLARYSSLLTAKKSGSGRLEISEPRMNVKVNFRKRSFLQYVKRQTTEKKHIREEIRKIPNSNLFSVKYNELNVGLTHQKILEFLGIQNTSFNLISNQAKRNQHDMLERFNNREEVIKFLDKHPEYQDWSQENIL